MLIYGVYLSARVYGFHYQNSEALSLGADWLAIGQLDHRCCSRGCADHDDRCRLDLSKNNLMVLSIRSMLTEFFCMSSAPIGVKADEVVQS